MSAIENEQTGAERIGARIAAFVTSRRFILSLVSLVSLATLSLSLVPMIDTDTRHILIVVTVLLVVHLLDHLVVSGENERVVREQVEGALDERSASLRELGREIADEAIGRDLWKQHGIESVYAARRHVAEQLFGEIEAAKKRVLLSGIALMDDVHLQELLGILRRKINDGVEVRLLMLDPLHSPALFRTLLKQDRNTLPDYGTGNGHGDGSPPRIYFDSEIFNMFLRAKGLLVQHDELFRASSRFYSHLPGFWLAIADDAAYMQSYAYGTVSTAATTRFDEMPVLKIVSRPGGRMFSALVAHFYNLWWTSDVDLFHMRARTEDREDILSGIYERGRHWIDHAVYVRTSRADRRQYVRQPCRATSLDLALNGDQAPVPIKIIRDCSRSGLGIVVEDACGLVKGSLVHIGGDLDSVQGAVRLLVHMLQQKDDNRFEVASVRKDSTTGLTLLGLHRQDADSGEPKASKTPSGQRRSTDPSPAKQPL